METNELNDSLTLRQRAGYSDISNWAESVGLFEEFKAIYLTFNLGHYELSPLGNILDFLGSKNTLETLHQWSDNQSANILREFISTYTSASLPLYTPLSRVKWVRDDFKGKLKALYLIALITQEVPRDIEDDLLPFYEQFKLWLIVQNLGRLISNNYCCDYYIQRLCSQLFTEKKKVGQPSKIKAFDLLYNNFKVFVRGVDCDFKQFSNALIYAAKQIPENSKSDTAFISAITHVSKGTIKEIINPGINERDSRPNIKLPITSHDAPFNWDDLINDDGTGEQVIISGGEQPELILATQHPDDPRPLISKGDETLSDNSVIMQTLEEKHFLKWTMDQPLPHEIPILFRWVTSLLESADINSQAAGMISWLSLWLSRSPIRTEAISITNKEQKEWSISEDLTYLHRHSPQRHDPKKTEPAFGNWIQPSSDSYRLLLPAQLTKVLTIIKDRANKLFQLNSVRDFWRQTSQIDFRSWWIKNIPEELSRISPALLGKHWQHKVFEQTRNPSCSKLLTSHPFSALSGASAYITIRGDEAAEAHHLQLESSLFNASSICMGSRLDLNDKIFRDAINEADQKLEDSAESDPIQHHNSVTAYVVTALFAATGARPVKDPFESPTFFNLSEGYVYIDDKNDGHTHTGRLCPLCPSVIPIIRRYLQHLKRVSQLLCTLTPDLSNELEKLSNSQESNILPFFFLLTPKLDWYSVSPSSLAEIDLFNCPLPANIFRHRFVQCLTRSGVDAEVVEGWCGHAERDVETYSDYSCHSWLGDKQKYLNHLEEAFINLQFSPPSVCDAQAPPDVTPAKLTKRTFGSEHRKNERNRATVKAIKEANLDLRLYVEEQGISFKEIESVHTDELTKRMLFRNNGTPHPRAGLRYQHLIKILEGISLTKAKKIKTSKRYRIPESGNNHVTPLSVHACELVQQLQVLLNKCCQTTEASSFHISKINQTDRLITAAVLLCLESHICYPKLLQDAMLNKGIALIQHGSEYYLRYTEHPDLGAEYDPAIQKRVSPLVAELISDVLNRKRKIKPETKIPKHLAPLVQLLKTFEPISFSCSTPKELINTLCLIIDQSNLVECPGIVCGELSGRVMATSFSLPNWCKTMGEDRYIFPDNTFEDEQDSKLEIDKLRALPKGISAIPDNANDLLYQNTLTFFSEIKKNISQNTPSNIASAVKQTSNNWTGKVSPAVLLLSVWFEDRLRRGNLRTNEDLKESTIVKYWGLLSNVFQELGYCADLMLMDEEEITSFYQSCFAYREKKKENEGFYNLLSDFIKWSTSLGVTSPFWEEIDIPINARSVRPGFILESEHLRTISQLIPTTDQVDDENLYAAFIQICSYRYGLRLMEAAGLLRKDICLTNDNFRPIIFVRRNKHRDLKTFCSRRVVPLLFELTEIERWVIQKVLSNYDSCIGKRTNGPLLFAQPNTAVRLPPITPYLSRIALRLNRTLKTVTQNKECVFHDNRHSFANIVAGALFDIADDLPARIFPLTFSGDSIRRTLLGTHCDPSRRSSMALARLMGHASPKTTFRSYLHIIPYWSDWFFPQDSTSADLTTSFNTKDLVKPSPIGDNIPDSEKKPEYDQLQLLSTFKLLRLASIGKDFQQAGAYLNLHPGIVETVDHITNWVGHQMEYGRKKGETTAIKGREHPLEYIKRVSDESWARILDLVKQMGSAPFEKLAGLRPIDTKHLLGKTRQVQLANEQDFVFIRTLLDYFRLPNSSIRTTGKLPIPELVSFSQEAGIDLIPHSDSGTRETPLRLDSNYQRMSSRAIYLRTSDFVSLVINRNNEHALRNSFDLALCILAVGAYLECSRYDSA